MDAAKTKFLLLGLAVVGLGILLGTALWLRVGPPREGWGRASGDAAESLNHYGPVPDFAFTERSGRTVSLDQLRGKIWIADFIYTTCTDTCPLQTAMMARLQQEYIDKPEIQFVSFSVDPERDTPPVLTAYAAKHQADAARWYFLTGQRDRMIRLIQDGFHLAVATMQIGGDASGMITHSPRFVLIDKETRIRGYYDSRELEAFLRLKNHIDILLKG
jgi:cytochrome oxidase Cu insertion factor (SCO1/SenC/PrrC family)